MYLFSLNMSNYYESIVQIRPYDERVVAYIKEQMKYTKVTLAKEVYSKHGVDFYFSSNNFAIFLGGKLKRRFKGTIKRSRTLYGVRRKSSKLSYRVTICFRLDPPETESEQ